MYHRKTWALVSDTSLIRPIVRKQNEWHRCVPWCDVALEIRQIQTNWISIRPRGQLCGFPNDAI